MEGYGRMKGSPPSAMAVVRLIPERDGSCGFGWNTVARCARRCRTNKIQGTLFLYLKE